MTIQLLEEGIKTGDMSKIVKGFNSITGKKLKVPSEEKIDNDTEILNEIVSMVGAFMVKLERIANVSIVKEALVDDTSAEEKAEEEEEEEDKEEQEDIEKVEEEEIKEKKSKEQARDEDGKIFEIKREEGEEKEFLKGNRVKQVFITNKSSKEEEQFNKKYAISKNRMNNVVMRKCSKCSDKTSNIYRRKDKDIVLCQKCENNEIRSHKK